MQAKKSGIKTHKYYSKSVKKNKPTLQHSWKLIANTGDIVAGGAGLNKKPGKKYFLALIKQLQKAVEKL